MSMNVPARIFVVEDHAYMKEMLREFLSLEDDLEVCDTADSGKLRCSTLMRYRRTSCWSTSPYPA
ncbi:hypothetical protein [Modicisalibacter luteus]|uniref:hypothetical protein n=1 Tax=Modicisalibacter luteus TaxID=453962 RepID=UPI003634C7E6